MTPDQAKTIVTYLVGAFRPYDWGRTSEGIYVTALLDFEFEPAMAIARRGVFEWWPKMPSPMELRSEIGDHLPPPPRPELPEHKWTEDDERAARQAMAKAMAIVRERRAARGDAPVAARRRPLAPPDRIEIDQAEVERKRALARQMVAEYEAREAAEAKATEAEPSEGAA